LDDARPQTLCFDIHIEMMGEGVPVVRNDRADGVQFAGALRHTKNVSAKQDENARLGKEETKEELRRRCLWCLGVETLNRCGKISERGDRVQQSRNAERVMHAPRGANQPQAAALAGQSGALSDQRADA